MTREYCKRIKNDNVFYFAKLIILLPTYSKCPACMHIKLCIFLKCAKCVIEK